MLIRMLYLMVWLFITSVSCPSVFSQHHSEEDVKQFEREFLQILEAGITPFHQKGEFVELGSGGGFSNARTNIAANRRFEFRAPDGDSKVTYDISLGKYDSAVLGRGGADAVKRQLAADVEPSKVIGVNEKMEGEGALEIGDSSYYAGVHSAANTRTPYQFYRHTAFAQLGEWLVKIEITISKEGWNDAIKAQQIAILKSLIDSTNGTPNDEGVATAPPVYDAPNLSGVYQIEGSSWRLQQDGERLYGTNEVDGITVTFETKYTLSTRQNEQNKIVEFGSFVGTYQAVNNDLDQMSGEIRIEKSAVAGELTLTTYFTADGEYQTQSATLKKG